MSIEAETDVDKYRTHRRLPLSSQQLSRKRDSLRLIPNAEASDRTRYGIGGIYSGTAFLFRRARDIDTIRRRPICSWYGFATARGPSRLRDRGKRQAGTFV